MASIARVAAAAVVSAIILGAYAIVAPLLDAWVNPGTGLAVGLWLTAIVLSTAYGIVSYQFTQGEFGWKQALGLLAHLTLGWLKHWRLIVCLALVTAGLVAVASSPKIYTTSAITGYRYVLHKNYADVVGSVTAGTQTVEVVTDINLINMVVQKQWITYVNKIGVGLSTVLADATLIEFPVRTYIQTWYLDMGYVIVGLALIVAGLLFGTYHAVVANNKLLEVCGEHTAKYHANMLRLAGYEVPEGYESALAEFYKTGKAASLRRFQE
jgi:hypothetical protein